MNFLIGMFIQKKIQQQRQLLIIKILKTKKCKQKCRKIYITQILYMSAKCIVHINYTIQTNVLCE